MIDRRTFSLAASVGLFGPLGHARAADGVAGRLVAEFQRIEQQVRGRLGVAVLDTATGTRIEHRGDERFPLTSTFKLLAAAAVLARVDAGAERLDRPVRVQAADLVSYSPFTERQAGAAVPLGRLCEAAVTLSDNTAANLMLRAIGGPAGVTGFARSLGDPVTRLDRIEPELNEATPGDPRDTTTPAAMCANLQALLLGNALSAASREQLTRWLVANQTGGTRLRAGLPRDWRVGDKTGGGGRGSTNDVAVAWPPQRPPILIAAYLTQTEAPAKDRDAAIASVAAAVAAVLGH